MREKNKPKSLKHWGREKKKVEERGRLMKAKCDVSSVKGPRGKGGKRNPTENLVGEAGRSH